ncbi:integrin alpha-E isoform X1 [Xenopus laevis]|uniref:Integrin alpha-E isoform X1 n=1 Tax=Xenopus laevis TaxID=8355 RepID=A0A8J1M950_XENLA|nr:integrin alpha-E isoform X1 [Xenopus laevis]
MRTGIQILAFIFIITIVAVSCFNIDTAEVLSFKKNEKSHFGLKVKQYSAGSERGVYVTSPLEETEGRKAGGVFKCPIDFNNKIKCTQIDLDPGEGQLPGTAYPIVTLAQNMDTMVACQQRKGRQHRSTTEELNGVCFLFEKGSHTQTFTNITKNAQMSLLEKNTNNNNNVGRVEPLINDIIYAKSPKSALGNANNNNNNNNLQDDGDTGTEIAIVLDGSGSISKEDFQKAKDFISNMITMFWEKCLECQFAVVQYGDIIQTEFDIQESRNGRSILQKVKDIQQVGNVTKTASALLHVLDSIFTEEHGSVETATKIILVLTDGDIFWDPVDINDVMNKPQMTNIERFVIGVGEAFEKDKALKTLKTIASQGEEHLLTVDDYSKLQGLLTSLQQKIIGIEGTKGDALEFELAEAGFSAHLKTKESMILGAVGAFDWSGGLMLYQINAQPHKIIFLNETKEKASEASYSYLGYSVTTAERKHTSLYISGAPRHSNVGKVLIFEKDIRTYRLSQELKGEQIGSYFGSELCSVDIDFDNYTDLLMVGAPFYHIKGEEGRVYVYRLNDEGHHKLFDTLEQPQYPFARFGYSIANIGDISGDGYKDIAIGAPLEGHLENPDSFGSVYIYNGESNGIRTTPSQRIRASTIKKAPRYCPYFGLSIDGGLDLTNDEYPDIAVGSLGSLIILRSRLVVQLKASVDLTPKIIPVINTNTSLTARLCFTITPFKQKEFVKSHLYYAVDLDVEMKQKRIEFRKGDSGKGKLFLVNDNCSDHVLTVLPCTDCFTSIKIKVSYTLDSDLNRDLPAPILDVYDHAHNHTYFEIPYEKDCNNKPVCIPNLKLTTKLSGNELIVGYTRDLIMTFSLVNFGDGSYLTTMMVTFPKTLQFKMVKTPVFPVIKCSPPEMLPPLCSVMSCSIGYPVFNKSSAEFSIIWQLEEVRFPTKNAVISLNVSNINDGSKPLNVQRDLLVKHSFTAIVTGPKTGIFVNVSEESAQSVDIQYTFHVNGENQFHVPLTLDLQMPVKIKGFNIGTLKAIQKTQNPTQCKNETKPCRSELPIATAKKSLEPCMCVNIQCKMTDDREDITVTAELSLPELNKLIQDTQELIVTGEILYDDSLYRNLKDGYHKAKIPITLLKLEIINTLPVIIGSTIGGILLLLLIIVILVKCGFFKRKYKTAEQDE